MAEFIPSATPEQIDKRARAFAGEHFDAKELVSEKEVRDALLERHGEQTQSKLDAARVAICGCGGLGSTAAIALARIGVGHLHLIDGTSASPRSRRSNPSSTTSTRTSTCASTM